MPSNEDLENTEDLEDLEELEELEEDQDDEDSEDPDIDRGDDFDSDEDGDDESDTDDQEGDEVEDSGDQEDTEEDQDQEEADPVKNKIPKKRLDQALKQRDDERDRSKWLESQLEKLIEKGFEGTPEQLEEEVDPFDYDAAEQKYMELVMEGDTGKASKVRNLINRSRQEDTEALILKATKSVSEKATGDSSRLVEDSKFVDLVETYEGLHPFLDSESDDFDEDKTKLVNTLLAGYVAQGSTKRDALKAAVKQIVTTTSKKPADKTKLGTSRTKQARKKSADASNRQPAKNRSKSVSNRDVGEVTISKLSERDYNKLTLKERKILRGD